MYPYNRGYEPQKGSIMTTAIINELGNIINLHLLDNEEKVRVLLLLIEEAGVRLNPAAYVEGSAIIEPALGEVQGKEEVWTEYWLEKDGWWCEEHYDPSDPCRKGDIEQCFCCPFRGSSACSNWLPPC